MTDARERDLIRRVERLERERRWTWWVGIAMVGLLALASLGWASDHTSGPGELRAQAFILVDESGHTRGELGFLPGGEGGPRTPALLLWGKDGHITAQLDAFPSLNFLGKDERSRMTMSVRSDDDPVLELIDSEGVKRVLVGRGDLKPAGADVVKKDPVFSIVLRGPDGKPVWKTP
jgi:hypothetical protein